MLYFVIKCALSGIIIAAVSQIAKRSPAFRRARRVAAAAFAAELPLALGDTGDAERIAGVSETTFWYVLPSLPLFLILPATPRAGAGFWPSLTASCAVTVILYFITAWVLARFGIHL